MERSLTGIKQRKGKPAGSEESPVVEGARSCRIFEAMFYLHLNTTNGKPWKF